jgi:hypothetical protein
MRTQHTTREQFRIHGGGRRSGPMQSNLRDIDFGALADVNTLFDVANGKGKHVARCYYTSSQLKISVHPDLLDSRKLAAVKNRDEALALLAKLQRQDEISSSTSNNGQRGTGDSLSSSDDDRNENRNEQIVADDDDEDHRQLESLSWQEVLVESTTLLSESAATTTKKRQNESQQQTTASASKRQKTGKREDRDAREREKRHAAVLAAASAIAAVPSLRPFCLVNNERNVERRVQVDCCDELTPLAAMCDVGTRDERKRLPIEVRRKRMRAELRNLRKRGAAAYAHVSTNLVLALNEEPVAEPDRVHGNLLTTELMQFAGDWHYGNGDSALFRVKAPQRSADGGTALQRQAELSMVHVRHSEGGTALTAWDEPRALVRLNDAVDQLCASTTTPTCVPPIGVPRQLVAARSRYCCRFFAAGGDSVRTVAMVPFDQLRFKRALRHVAFAPGEASRNAVLSTDAGAVCVWHDDQRPAIMLDARSLCAASSESRSVVATFGAHPLTLLASSDTGMGVFDLRAPRVRPVERLVRYDVTRDGRCCGLMRHPVLGNYALRSASHSVALWDVRYMRAHNPVMQWRHHLDDSDAALPVQVVRASRIDASDASSWTAVLLGRRTGAARLFRFGMTQPVRAESPVYAPPHDDLTSSADLAASLVGYARPARPFGWHRGIAFLPMPRDPSRALLLRVCVDTDRLLERTVIEHFGAPPLAEHTSVDSLLPVHVDAAAAIAADAQAPIANRALASSSTLSAPSSPSGGVLFHRLVDPKELRQRVLGIAASEEEENVMVDDADENGKTVSIGGVPQTMYELVGGNISPQVTAAPDGGPTSQRSVHAHTAPTDPGRFGAQTTLLDNDAAFANAAQVMFARSALAPGANFVLPPRPPSSRMSTFAPAELAEYKRLKGEWKGVKRNAQLRAAAARRDPNASVIHRSEVPATPAVQQLQRSLSSSSSSSSSTPPAVLHRRIMSSSPLPVPPVTPIAPPARPLFASTPFTSASQPQPQSSSTPRVPSRLNVSSSQPFDATKRRKSKSAKKRHGF